ncbi:MAG: putative toxin-antitoxin system toxin component, PIN family [Methanosarcinaceae archaeon]
MNPWLLKKLRKKNQAFYIIPDALIATLIELNVDIDIIKKDSDDNRVLECAVSARATVIVSGDSHLLNLNDYAGIQIISTIDFIKQISG